MSYLPKPGLGGGSREKLRKPMAFRHLPTRPMDRWDDEMERALYIDLIISVHRFFKNELLPGGLGEAVLAVEPFYILRSKCHRGVDDATLKTTLDCIYSKIRVERNGNACRVVWG